MLKKSINYILEHTFFSLNISLVKSSIVSNVCRFLYMCVGLALTFFSSMDNIISRPVKPMKPQNFPSRMQHASTKVILLWFLVLYLVLWSWVLRDNSFFIFIFISFPVVRCEKAADSLGFIQKRKGRLDLAVTEVHVPQVDRVELLKNIQQFRLPVIC